MSQTSSERDTSGMSSPIDNDNTRFDNLDSGNHEEDDVFVWQDYLDVTNSVEVPAILFNHVEQSLLNGLEEGMAMEVPLKDPGRFWLATIVMACGPLLRLRYVGDPGGNRTKEFWCDLTKVIVHPVGWCESQGIDLTPPDELQHKLPDIADIVDKVMSDCRIHAPEELLTGIGLAPVDRIKQGMKVEIQDKHDPYRLWSGTIVENVGGRVYLSYDSSSLSHQHFWDFYSSPRIFKSGWATENGHPWVLSSQENGSITESPDENNSYSSLPSDLFQHKPLASPHEFQVGMKILAVNAESMSEIGPASIAKVFDSEFFLVRMDAYKDGNLVPLKDAPTWMCTKEHPYILPIGWSEAYNFPVTAPRGWRGEFRWSEYLSATASLAAPKSCFPSHASARHRGFRAGMKLEAVNPLKPNDVCAATVLRSVDHLLVITLECFDSNAPSIIASTESLEIFPVGWCESNGYSVVPPRFYKIPAKVEAINGDGDSPKPEPVAGLPAQARSAWCPKIYFNHKCFTGLLLSKGKLAMLPRSVGPGPVTLVMHEVLGMVIASGYMPTRVLKVLKLNGLPDRGMHAEIHKAKYKGNSYSASVAVITSAGEVADFCRSICLKLQICPHLFGPTQVPANSCPNKCHTFTKSSNGLGLRKLSVALDDEGPCHAVKRRKKMRRNCIFNTKRFQKKAGPEEDAKPEEKPPLTEEEFASLRLLAEGSVTGVENTCGDGESAQRLTGNPQISSISSASDIKRKYKRQSVPISDIKTRGAQLPKYSSHWRRKGERRKNGSQNLDAKTLLSRTPEYSYDNYLLKAYKIKLPKYPHAITLESNPLCWTEKDIYWYLKRTEDCAHLADICKAQLIDGHSFMLLNLPTIKYNLNLNTLESLKLCRHVEDMKLAHYIQYVAKCET